MARKVFYSFHYEADNWRASKVRNIGSIEGNQPAADNDWESVTKGGDAAIERWINNQMSGRSCIIVLIGAGTAGRKWIKYEIERAWSEKKGLLGIHIHQILDRNDRAGLKGNNPFSGYTVDGTALTSIVKTYDPPGLTSKDVYAYISKNIAAWIDDAIAIRAKHE